VKILPQGVTKMCLKCLIEDEIKRLQRRNGKIENDRPNQLRKNDIALVALVREAAILLHHDCPFAKKDPLTTPAAAAVVEDDAQV